MTRTPVTILWFRRDLRLSDNPALTAAAAKGLPVLPLYTDDPVMGLGDAQEWWLAQSLQQLNGVLEGQLRYVKGPAQQAFDRLLANYDVQGVFWNRCYEPDVLRRDKALAATLTAQGIEVQTFKANLLLEADEVKSPKGLPYKVFTPYWKTHQKVWQPTAPLARPTFTIAPGQADPLPRFEPKWAAAFGDHWTPGEQGAQRRLADFLDRTMAHYAEGRDYPADALTSRLSPHLCFGEVSPRQVAWATLNREQPCWKFMAELGWREFAYHLLAARPDMVSSPLKSQYEQFPWRQSEADLKRWQKGRTGYDFVDAAMIELWQSGYMHNRLRMIAASFLVKNLRLDWRLGQAWFKHTLLDHDLAVNAASWQWVAGCGTDAAPYFRIFNPESQAEKFDGLQRYRQQWLAGQGARPDPIVDLKASRQAALEALDSIKDLT